jgi:hypothetical protein
MGLWMLRIPDQILKIHRHKNSKMARWAWQGPGDQFKGREVEVLPQF